MKVMVQGFPVFTRQPGQKMIPGIYAVMDDRDMPPFTRSDVPCPYCRQLMRKYEAPGIYRVFMADDDGRGMAEDVPLTHVVLACSTDDGGCDARFTVPK